MQRNHVDERTEVAVVTPKPPSAPGMISLMVGWITEARSQEKSKENHSDRPSYSDLVARVCRAPTPHAV